MSQFEQYDLLEIEKTLLRSVMVGKAETRSHILRKYKPEYFETLHDLYMLLQELIPVGNDAMISIDVLALNDRLSAVTRGIVLALQYVVPIEDITAIDEIARPLVNHYNAHKILETLQPTLEGVKSREINPADAVSQLLITLEDYNNKLVTSDEPPLELGHGVSFEEMSTRVFQPREDAFIQSGFNFIDDRAGGYSPGDFIVYASPSSHGKTMMMVQGLGNALFSCANQHISGLYVTMEISDVTVMHRLVAARAGLPLGAIRDTTKPERILLRKCKTDLERQAKLAEVDRYRKLANIEMAQLQENLASSKNKLTILKRGSFTPLDLLRELSINHYDFVCLDYINLMQCSSGKKDMSDWLRIMDIGRDLKMIAQDKKIVLVTGQQLSKEGELRYATGLKDHTDILMTWSLTPEIMEQKRGIADVNITKGRNIGIFNHQMMFDLICQRITESDDPEASGALTLPGAGDSPLFGDMSMSLGAGLGMPSYDPFRPATQGVL